MNLQQNLKRLEVLSKTYCLGKVEGTITTPKIGTGEYYAYANGMTYLANSINEAVTYAIDTISI